MRQFVFHNRRPIKDITSEVVIRPPQYRIEEEKEKLEREKNSAETKEKQTAED